MVTADVNDTWPAVFVVPDLRILREAQAGSCGLWKALDGCVVTVVNVGSRVPRTSQLRPPRSTPQTRRRAQNDRIGLPLARLVTGPDRKARSRRTVLP
jgi:hypothetical protein